MFLSPVYLKTGPLHYYRVKGVRTYGLRYTQSPFTFELDPFPYLNDCVGDSPLELQLGDSKKETEVLRLYETFVGMKRDGVRKWSVESPPLLSVRL